MISFSRLSTCGRSERVARRYLTIGVRLTDE
jgi:hypothetical protein